MLLPIKPICEKKFLRRDGTSLIYIQYCYSSENRTLLNTEIAIPPNSWNKKKLCIADNLPHSVGNVHRLNSELDRMVRQAHDIVSYATRNKIEDRGCFEKQTFKSDFDVKALNRLHASNVSNLQQEKKVSKATICVYNCMKKYLQAYEEFRK